MGLEQAQAFAKGLQDLITEFKAEQKKLADEYAAYISEAGAEFQEKSHTYAKDSVQGVDDLATDIQELYKETYGEELPPPTGGEGENGGGEGGEGEEGGEEGGENPQKNVGGIPQSNPNPQGKKQGKEGREGKAY